MDSIVLSRGDGGSIGVEDGFEMNETSRTSPWIILPVCIVGLLVVLFVGATDRDRPSTAEVTTISPAEEARIVMTVTEATLSELPAAPNEIARFERKLLLRRNNDPRRQLEVAAGLLVIATRHLELAHAAEAMRVAQLASDLAPDSLIAARGWMLGGRASTVMHPDLPLSIRYFERADAILRSRLRQHPDEVDALRLRASVALWLGQNQGRFQRNDEAIKSLQLLIGETPESRVQSAADRLRAMLSLGDLLRTNGKPVEGDALLADALEYGCSDEVPASEALHTLADSIRHRSSDPNDPARLDPLRVLWNTDRFEGLPEWFQIGDELASSDFFHDPMRTADFEIVSRKLLAFLPQMIEHSDPGDDEHQTYESLLATHLLLATESARRRDDRSEFDRLVRQFEQSFAGRDVTLVTPLERPAQRLATLGEIYRHTMKRHVEQLEKQHAFDERPASR